MKNSTYPRKIKKHLCHNCKYNLKKHSCFHPAHMYFAYWEAEKVIHVSFEIDFKFFKDISNVSSKGKYVSHVSACKYYEKENKRIFKYVRNKLYNTDSKRFKKKMIIEKLKFLEENKTASTTCYPPTIICLSHRKELKNYPETYKFIYKWNKKYIIRVREDIMSFPDLLKDYLLTDNEITEDILKDKYSEFYFTDDFVCELYDLRRKKEFNRKNKKNSLLLFDYLVRRYPHRKVLRIFRYFFRKS